MFTLKWPPFKLSVVFKGSNPETKDKQGDDAISLAMEYGHVQIAQIIENAKKANLASNC